MRSALGPPSYLARSPLWTLVVPAQTSRRRDLKPIETRRSTSAVGHAGEVYTLDGTASLLRLRCRHPLRLAGADRLVDHLPDHEKLPSYRVGQRLKHREPVACNHCFYEPGTEPGTEQGSQQDEITAISVECKRSHLTRALGRVCARRTSHSSPSRRHGRQLTPRSKRSGERSRYGAAEKARLRSNLRTRLSEASTSRNLRLHLRQDAECDQDER